MIPVIINNRDLLTWPRAMIEKIKMYRGVGEIIILDNASTYPPLLAWYRSCPYRVVKTSNLGHTAPWISGLVASLQGATYVVTDPDLGLEATPPDTLLYLQQKLQQLDLPKLGLDLDWAKVSQNSPYYKHVQSYERVRREKSKIMDGVMSEVKVDTTFALYGDKFHLVGGASTVTPYIARHYPWEFTWEEYQKNSEFKYYVEHASGSSSYKQFLGL